MTDDLIDRLSSDLRPVRTGGVVVRLGLALSAGGAVAFIGVAWLLGLRPDMARAVSSGMFWAKLAYTGAAATAGFLCIERLSRPAGKVGLRLAWLGLPLASLVGAAVIQLLDVAPGGGRHLVMGGSAMVCPGYIAATSLPGCLMLIWALRGLAPVRLRLAGAAAGLAAGGLAAAIYSLHCPESGAPFVAIWYTLGILLPAAAGALAGPRLLRW